MSQPARTTWRTAGRWLAVVVALAAVCRLGAQPPAEPPLFPPDKPGTPQALAAGAVGAGTSPGAGPFAALAKALSGALPEVAAWNFRGPLSDRYGRQKVGAQTLFLRGFNCVQDLPSALGELAVLQSGDDGRPDAVPCWSLLDTDRVQPFPAAFKEPGVIRDGKEIPVGTDEPVAFADVVTMAYYTSEAAFRKASRSDLTYAQVFAEPARYRGEVVHIGGRLKRLSRLDPPLEAKAQGVTDLYNAWIFNDAFGMNPFVAVFTVLPARMNDLVGQDKIKGTGVEVSFDGYFYKKFRYKAADSKERTAREAPVFIGRTLVPRLGPAPPEEPAGEDWSGQIMAVFLGIVGLGVVVVVGLTWWFRRSDERVRRRLVANRRPEFLPPDDDATDFSAPAR
jgi:hypothetical protein